MHQLILKKGEERRVKAGHLWVFSNEVDTHKSPLRQLEPGDPVAILDSRESFLAQAYAHPGTLISARVVSSKPSEPLGRELIAKRLREALELRQAFFAEPYYRLFFAEGDALPGLVIDRYADLCVVQLTTFGLERMADEVAAALDEVLAPRQIVFKNDAASRELEGLPREVHAVTGEVPETVTVKESGCRFNAPLAGGQKTGWFYDQRLNRREFAKHAKGRRVLDAFSYVGSFGIMAAKAGAEEVVLLDASQTALDFAMENAKANGVAGKVRVVKADAHQGLEALRAEGLNFELMSLDPPAYVKHRKDLKKGLAAYARLNREAMKLLTPGGLLMSSSCSQQVGPQAFREAIQRAAGQRRVRSQLLWQGHQGPDHPIHPAMPETEYLKALLLRVLRS